jgi:competence protein ComEA
MRPIVVLLTLFSLAASPALAQTPAQSTQNAAATAKAQPIVNLNTATVTDLQTLPGIGATVAARILEYREKNGPFKKIEELMNVRGIGEKSFLKLRSQVTVAAETGAARP